LGAFHQLRVYLQYARCAFQRRAAYRLANWTGLLVNFAFFVIHAEVIRAFYGTRDEVAGWTADDAVLYYAASQALIMVVTAFPDRLHPLMERIRTGDVVLDLARPVSLYPREIAERFGNGLYFLMARGVVIYAAATLLYRVSPPLGSHLWLAPVSIALAIAVSGSLWYLANASAFWTEHAAGSLGLVMLALAFFGGLEVPLVFYPDWLQALCNALPFRAAFYTPMALLSGRLEGAELWLGLGHQVTWLGLLVLTCRAVEARGVRRLVALGG